MQRISLRNIHDIMCQPVLQSPSIGSNAIPFHYIFSLSFSSFISLYVYIYIYLFISNSLVHILIASFLMYYIKYYDSLSMLPVHPSSRIQLISKIIHNNYIAMTRPRSWAKYTCTHDSSLIVVYLVSGTL